MFGCAGPVLSDWERSFFRDADPLGFCLFRRNCLDRAQVAALTAAFRECVGRADAPVLIDQEGGRVQRLRPPAWDDDVPAARFGTLYRADPNTARAAVTAQMAAIAADLAALGVTVNAAPVADLGLPGVTPAIGDRAYADDPDIVADLAGAAAEALLAGGILPVIKHMPGHGRATVDSHDALPTVDTDRDTLLADIAPFKRLADLPWGMTAHVRYLALDPAHPATLSATVIETVIRGEIGFDGLLLSDDLSMGALDGPVGRRGALAVAAGCDVALHCCGDRDEMQDLAAEVPVLTERAVWRLQRGMERLLVGADRPAADPSALRTEVQRLLGGAAAA